MTHHAEASPDSAESGTAIAQWDKIPADVIAAHDPEGDYFKKHLLNPAIFELLGNVENQRVLDAGSGQGYLSRLLAARGAVVTSVEPSGAMFNHSVQKERELKQGITLLRQDLTRDELPAVFDAAVASMVFLSVPNWLDAFRNVAGSLRSGGRLVFSVGHPLFEIATNDFERDGYITIRNYLEERPVQKSVATDFHRRISSYMNALTDCGMRFNRMLEPELLDPADRPNGAEVYTRIPIFLVISATRE